MIHLKPFTLVAMVFISPLAASASHYTQAEYVAKLSETPVAGGNLHSEAGKYKADFVNEGWPEAAHVLWNYLQYNHLVNPQIGYDGISHEGLNYHYLWLGGYVRLAEVLEGYSDPPGYTNPVNGTRFDNLTYQEIIPPDQRWNQYIQNSMMSLWPDVTDSGYHDTGISWNDPLDPLDSAAWGAGVYHFSHYIEPMAVSYLLPALGQLGLGAQRTDEYGTTTQALLHYSPKTSSSHRHNDSLMMGFFGRGRKLLSFPGHNDYTHGPMNKNMVIIDDDTWQNHYVSDLQGRLECYAPMTGLKIARVDGSHIGHGGSAGGVGTVWPNRYRRTLMLNTVDYDRAYLLDIFEVDGGSVHSYLIGGSANTNQEDAVSNVSTAPTSNPFGSDPKQWGQHIDMRKGTFSDTDPVYVDFRFSWDTSIGTRSWIPAGEGGELYLSRLNEVWNNTDRPNFMIRRTGTAPLKSTFIAVHEALDGSGASFISSVTRTNLGSTAVGVLVSLTDGREDTYLVSFDGPQAMSFNGLHANAVIASSSTLGTGCDLWMQSGTMVSNALRTLTAGFPEQTGTVSTVLRNLAGDGADAFETDMALPDGNALAGQTLFLEVLEGDGSLEFTDAYTIDYVESTAGGSRIHVRHDPGVEIDGSGYVKELFWPFRGDTNSIVGSKGYRAPTPSHRLRFRSSATTIPQIADITPGEEWWQRVPGTVGRAFDHGQAMEWTTVPEWSPVAFEFEGAGGQGGQTYETLPLSGEGTVRLTTLNPGGLAEPPVIKQRFHGPQRAIPATGTTPGLRDRIYSWYGNPQWRWEQTIHGLGNSDVNLERDRGNRITGYIDAPATGLYRFYARCDSTSSITIDGVLVESQQGMRGAPQWVGEIYLEQGLHELEIDHFSFTSPQSFDIRWDGPGIPYQPIPSNVLYRAISSASGFELDYRAADGGSVQGNTNQVIALDAGGTPLSTPTAVTAVADPGHEFVSWNDGLATATRQDVSLDEHATFMAYFSPTNGPGFDTPLRAWRHEQFGSPENEGGGANNLDADGDGIRNLMEYALRLDPHDGVRTNLPFLSIEPPKAFFTYRQLTGNPGVDYIPEWSTNLVLNRWHATGFSNEVASVSGDGGHQTTRSGIALDQPARFFRLNVTE